MWLLAQPPAAHAEFGGVWKQRGRYQRCPDCENDGFAEIKAGRRVAWETGQKRRFGAVLWAESWGGELFVGPDVAACIDGFVGVSARRLRVEERAVSYSTGKPKALLPEDFLRRLKTFRELVVDGRVPLDRERTPLVESLDEPPCETCGRFAVRWGPTGPAGPRLSNWVQGAEAYSVNTRYEALGPEYDVTRHPFEPGEGAFFRAGDVGELNAWRLAQDARWILCDSTFKAAIEDTPLTNLEFHRVGTIIDG